MSECRNEWIRLFSISAVHTWSPVCYHVISAACHTHTHTHTHILLVSAWNDALHAEQFTYIRCQREGGREGGRWIVKMTQLDRGLLALPLHCVCGCIIVSQWSRRWWGDFKLNTDSLQTVSELIDYTSGSQTRGNLFPGDNIIVFRG